MAVRWCGLVLVAACTAEAPECPAGQFGCPCASGGECNAGFVCADDGVCRDDEELETESSSTSTTVTSTTITSTEESTAPETTFTTTFEPTSTTGFTSGDLPCACGWGGMYYTCGEGLPPVGPPGKGMPDCGEEGLLVGDLCENANPPITYEGCCASEMFLAFCDPETLRIRLQECLVTKFGCVPAK